MSQAPTLDFVGLKVSPYSFRARWALLHNGYNSFHSYTEYKPMVSEYWLRWRTGIRSGKITVPVLFVHDHEKNEDVILTDSFDIAKYSDNNKLNDSSRIVPDDQVEEIKKWNEIADNALNAARSDAVIEMGKDEEAKTEQVPGFLKTIGLGSFVGGQGVNYFLSKYPSDIEQNHRIIRENLIKVRAA